MITYPAMNQEKTLVTQKDKTALGLFRTLVWTGLSYDEDGVSVNLEQESIRIPLLVTEEFSRTINLVFYNQKNGEYKYKSWARSVRVDRDFDISLIFYFQERGYRLSYDQQIRSILSADGEIEILSISSGYKSIAYNSPHKTLQIPTKMYLEIMSDAKAAFDKSKKYRNSTQRFLINQLREKHSKKRTKDTTSIEKGEFNFLVSKLNLSTKRKKTDFEKYLDTSDISSLQDLVSGLLKNGVFSSDFLRKLNDYFIREKLKEIIKIGKKILNLKSSNLKTLKAKEIMDAVVDDKKDVKQLEALWQKYFEKYLLFLIFTYKEIFPKIKLNDIDDDKKYPDFIGINHYNGVDVIEIKTHLKPALIYDKSHKNFAFSSDLSKAIIQTTNYMDAIIHTSFKNPIDRQKITNSSQEENLNRPRGIIIISSLDKLASNLNGKNRAKAIRDFTKLRNSLHNIEILTFDEIINIADDYLANIINKTNSAE